MIDYISREAAIDAIFGQFCASSDETETALNNAIEEIKSIPAADVRPVVFCGECKCYGGRERAGYTEGFCKRSDLCVGAFDFCSYGEKIEEC